MRFERNKTLSAIALILMLTTIAPLFALPTTSAHAPIWQIPTNAFLAVKPNPVGVNQQAFFVMWLAEVLPDAALTNDIRFHNYKLVITKPDNTTETKTWAVVSDTSSGVAMAYTPNQVGTYTLEFSFPGQTYTWAGAYQNDTYLPSSRKITITVQKDPIPSAIASYPLPTEYWTRPIEGENTDWWKISSNWLGRGSPQLAEGRFMVQPEGLGPKTPHVMWTKPIQDGGVVGGSYVGIEGDMFYTGLTYNRRFNNPIIMAGVLYYPEPLGLAPTGGPVKAVDLRTGEVIWSRTDINPIPAFGYYYTTHNPNMHGAFNGILFSLNFARAYDARSGTPLFNVTNIPINRAIEPTAAVGSAALGPNGEILLYVMNTTGRWIAQWNSSRLWNVLATPYPTIPSVVDASTPNRYDWNITLPEAIRPGMTVRAAFLNDVVLISNMAAAFGVGPSAYGTNDPYTVAAISLKPTTRGQLLWIKNYTASGSTRSMPGKLVDMVNRVFITYDKETMKINGFSVDDGSNLWTTGLAPDASDFNFYNFLGAVGMHTDYGKLYYSGYGGELQTFDTKTGALLWTYGNGGPGNTTNSGMNSPYDKYPTYIGAIANGIIYLDNGEHSANTPLYKGMKIRAVDAETGKELWTLQGWGGHHRREGMAVADGFLTYVNHYDMQIYSIGKGPSKTTVTAPENVQPLGTPVLLKGTVIDTAAGTNQPEQSARFPTGVPAVSDASMSDWMAYVYMQKPRPTNTTGVDVTLTVIDPSGSVQEFTTTSDAMGQFSYMWMPTVQGKYTIYARFLGSEAYWPSFAETFVGVGPAPSYPSPATPAPTTATATPTSTPTQPASPSPAPNPTGGISTEIYVVIASAVAISIIAIAAVILKRRVK
jgi:hypothetical protein